MAERKIIVEALDFNDACELLRFGVEVIQLDKFEPKMVKKCLILEIITLKTLK